MERNRGSRNLRSIRSVYAPMETLKETPSRTTGDSRNLHDTRLVYRP